jgi:hypothetical protein
MSEDELLKATFSHRYGSSRPPTLSTMRESLYVAMVHRNYAHYTYVVVLLFNFNIKVWNSKLKCFRF